MELLAESVSGTRSKRHDEYLCADSLVDALESLLKAVAGRNVDLAEKLDQELSEDE